jgi:hypothetical protein
MIKMAVKTTQLQFWGSELVLLPSTSSSSSKHPSVSQVLFSVIAMTLKNLH